MPYDSVAQAEEKNTGLEKYSAKAKRAWLEVFNKCFKEGQDESACFAQAYGAANKVDGRKQASSLVGLAKRILRCK